MNSYRVFNLDLKDEDNLKILLDVLREQFSSVDVERHLDIEGYYVHISYHSDCGIEHISLSRGEVLVSANNKWLTLSTENVLTLFDGNNIIPHTVYTINNYDKFIEQFNRNMIEDTINKDGGYIELRTIPQFNDNNQLIQPKITITLFENQVLLYTENKHVTIMSVWLYRNLMGTYI